MSQLSQQESKTWGLLAHLSGLLFPPLSLVATVAIWQTMGKQSEFVEKEALEALNFQLSILLYLTASGIALLAFVGALLLPAVGLFNIILSIIAGVKAGEGHAYQYPLCIRFIK